MTTLNINEEFKLAAEALKNNAKQAITNLTNTASKGHLQAQYLLAQCYLNGYGVKKDSNKAREWLSKLPSVLNFKDSRSILQAIEMGSKLHLPANTQPHISSKKSDQSRKL